MVQARCLAHEKRRLATGTLALRPCWTRPDALPRHPVPIRELWGRHRPSPVGFGGRVCPWYGNAIRDLLVLWSKVDTDGDWYDVYDLLWRHAHRRWHALAWTRSRRVGLGSLVALVAVVMVVVVRLRLRLSLRLRMGVMVS